MYLFHRRPQVILTAVRMVHASTSSAIVVSGASRGIGLEFVRQYLNSHEDTLLFALARSKSSALVALHDEFPNRLHYVPCDLENNESINSAATEVKTHLQGRSIQLLLNVAAILGKNTEAEPGPERSLRMLDGDWMRRSFQINCIGPALFTQQVLPLFTKTTNGNSGVPVSKVVNISARVGSITDNKLGGWYSYRMSKSALNMFTKTLSVEVHKQKCAVISLHPGTTNTELSQHFTKSKAYEVVSGTVDSPLTHKPDSEKNSAGKLFTTEYSVSCMRRVIQQLEMSDSGKCLAFDGSTIPY